MPRNNQSASMLTSFQHRLMAAGALLIHLSSTSLKISETYLYRTKAFRGYVGTGTRSTLSSVLPTLTTRRTWRRLGWGMTFIRLLLVGCSRSHCRQIYLTRIRVPLALSGGRSTIGKFK